MSPGTTARTPAVAPRALTLMPAVLQHEWDLYHATWFTLMGVGGGIFLLSRLMRLERGLGVWLGLPVVDLVSFAVISAGGLLLIWSLGRPLRFLRAVLKPGTSWISRGAIADFIFVVLGGALIVPGLTLGTARPFAWLPWDPWASTTAGRVIEGVALASAAIVIVYAGLVLADKAAVTFWRSWAIPTQFLLSSLAMSVATVMALQTANRTPIEASECWVLAGCLLLLLGAITWHLATRRAQPGKAEALARLYTTYGLVFWLGVIGAGTLLPLLLMVIAAAAPPSRDALGLAALVLTLGGGFLLRLLTLRVGYFPPVSGVLRVPKR
ncbi:MAG TPA: NrfD/PsrC family molybdoenzyme membrane anchor subunit [Methylomirabilota bacterium]|nr:NrfD/PsrC family molybdoenzyme membrane anchor subunit [Methylomirabilota bacterium]